MNDFTPTGRTRLRRRPNRGHYDRDTVHAILDAGFLAHVGYVIDGQPYVTPTSYWRHGETLYWHGSSASRMLRAVGGGISVCLTVAHLDGLVLARSGFNHSINYRSVMVFGEAELVAGAKAKLDALEHFMEWLYPGRWAELRAPTAQELKATTVLRMPLAEAVAKVRQGPPLDDEGDLDAPVWAGVVPVATAAGTPIGDGANASATRLPAYLGNFRFTKP
jgi:nitroimidazol reductase NimA-like FMN-containing flavoprotein (pyridoxamine 5'-phosphate oxidase superfamily)